MTVHKSVLYDVHDCKVYALTDDNGASPTYSAGIDVPGIAQVAINPNLITAELKGDGRVIAKKGRIDRFPMTATYGKLDMDVLTVIMGGAVRDAAAKAIYDYRASQRLPYFGIGVSIEDVEEDLGCIHVLLYKAQITGGTLLGQQSDSFGQPTFEVEGYGVDSTSGGWDRLMMSMVYYDTLTALPVNLGTGN